MNDKEKRFVDELLAASLRNYADAEPHAGLEGRILAGVHARQETARRHAAWVWATGVAGAAAMVTLILAHWVYRQPTLRPVAGNAPVTLSAPMVTKTTPPTPRRLAHHTAPSKVDTRPQQFPTPRPLSEQERLLVVYAQSLKDSSAGAAPDDNPDFDHDLEIPPLKIAAIKIKPLPPPEKMEDGQ